MKSKRWKRAISPKESFLARIISRLWRFKKPYAWDPGRWPGLLHRAPFGAYVASIGVLFFLKITAEINVMMSPTGKGSRKTNTLCNTGCL